MADNRQTRETQPIDLSTTANGPWLRATFVQQAPDGSMPAIRVVVTRARGLSLALDSTVDDAEDAARELLRVCAELRVGQENVPSRMHLYDYDPPEGGVFYVYETARHDAPPPDSPRKRGLAANGRQSLAQLRPWVKAWLDGTNVTRVAVLRADGTEEQEEIVG